MKQPNIKMRIEVSKEELELLANTLDDFSDISPALEGLKQTGLYDYGLVTDGEYTIIVCAEGFDYGRYKSDRIRNDALAAIEPTVRRYERLTHRKHTSLDTIETVEALFAAIGREVR